MITLTYAPDTITLPEDLFWADEYDWCPVEQATSRTLTGALIVDVGARAAGRPITLQPVDENSAWMTHATLNALRGWADAAGRQMVLSINGTARNVIFRHQDGAISATPVVHYRDYAAGDFHLVTLRFMEV